MHENSEIGKSQDDIFERLPTNLSHLLTEELPRALAGEEVAPEVLRSLLDAQEAMKTLSHIRQVLVEEKKPWEAEKMARACRRRFPDWAGFALELEANAVCARKGLMEAGELYVRASDLLEHRSLGCLLQALSFLRDVEAGEEAMPRVEAGLLHFPEDLDLLVYRAGIMSLAGKRREALEIARELCRDHPQASTWGLLIRCALTLGLAEEAVEAYEELLRLGPEANYWSAYVFISHYHPWLELEDLRAIIDRYRQALCDPQPWTLPAFLKRRKDPKRRLRIGLFSAGFHGHPVGRMAGPALWPLHLFPDCELYCYSTWDKASRHREELETDRHYLLCHGFAARWRDVGNWDDERLYKRALDDRLDIAVDMSGHGNGCLFPLFARRLAPIQVRWVGGLLDTSGVPQMDYLLSDQYETPPGCDDHYSEKIVRLPYSYVTFDLTDTGDVSRLPGKVGDPIPSEVPDWETVADLPIRFGSFNKSLKLNAKMDRVWVEILRRVPGSTLCVRSTGLEHEEGRELVRKPFVEAGLDPARLELLGGIAYHRLIKEDYRRIDICLDTWPYTGGLTTLEALWAGVPVVTLPGPSFAGRHALSHLSNVGLEALIAKDEEDYIRIAVKLAEDRAFLNELRVRIPHALATAPMTRPGQLAADLHTAFRAMWQRYCDDLPPVAMRFDQPTPIPDFLRPYLHDAPFTGNAGA